MQNNELSASKVNEVKNELLINKFRFVIAFIYVLTVILLAILRKIQGLVPFPAYGFIPNNVFLLFSIILFFYFKNKTSVPGYFKYICVSLDMIILSIGIVVGCTYPELDPPIVNISIWALFFNVLILLGAFRYSIPCAIYSGIFGGLCYFISIFLSRNALDFQYFFMLDSKTINVTFPLFNESFRSIAMIVTGFITGMACKRQLELFNDTLESKNKAAQSAADTVIKIFGMSKTINKSTDNIFTSSKEIFTTANNQAASIQEIEATITENAQIANEISGKTSEVAKISAKMEDDVIHGFNLLKQNINQLDDIKNENDAVITGIVELSSKLSKIRDFILSIEDITDQTKVIAFNAALEAASAGEYGKRFSVVASEVNRLADDITALTKQIKNQADEIQDSSSSLLTSGKNSAEKVSLGNNLIKELENTFTEIRNGAEITSGQAQTISVSTQKQQKSTEQIKIAISDISKGLANFIQSTRVATGSAEELTDMIKKLDDVLKNT